MQHASISVQYISKKTMRKTILAVIALVMALHTAQCYPLNNKLMSAGVKGWELEAASDVFGAFVDQCRRNFNQGKNNNIQLQQAAILAVNWFNYLQKTHFQGFTSVILGHGNEAYGQNNFILNPANGQFVNRPIFENNIIRFQGFDLRYDKVNNIAANPRAAIIPLTKWGA